MSVQTRQPAHSVSSTTVADLLERVLDKGIVIAGDIKINLVQVELLTIQIRLLVCSVDKAKEMGIDWWSGNRFLSKAALTAEAREPDIFESITRLESRLDGLEKGLRIDSTNNTVGQPVVLHPR